MNYPPATRRAPLSPPVHGRWLGGVCAALCLGSGRRVLWVRLGISARTVESHVGSVLRKLQLSSRHEVTHWATVRGLIDDDGADPS